MTAVRVRTLASCVASCLVLAAVALPPRAAHAQPDTSRAPRARVGDARLDAPLVEQPRAVEYGDWYGRRLTVHRWASYTMLPLFAAQYVLGDRILDQKADAYRGIGRGVDPDTKKLHQVTAGAVGGLFTLNTVTGPRTRFGTTSLSFI